MAVSLSTWFCDNPQPTTDNSQTPTFAAVENQCALYLLTGGNLGDRLSNLQAAARLIAARIGTVVRTSGYYETEAWGNVEQPHYINQALEVRTNLEPLQVLEAILDIETAIGRTRRSKWEPRVIDVDILFFENRIVDTPVLKIPHPLLHRRNFVLIPMLEIAPEMRHPVLGKSIEELYLESDDDLEVLLLEIENHPQ